ncbi:ABC transporter A [Chloropicon primus]|uniref:ABC transporter A n=1 Tax=Chloropicon primus TaxID=1764295 RepID=A0A5B8MN57_9CHLO|nr:ABC transporter A [Chloropicon primus]UPR01173.1 ABC transporter A [Chloropicon primus]|eukprot:QDZ21953.1 ABC transporter A [Chloropicon primus]
MKIALKPRQGYFKSVYNQVSVLLKKNAITTLRGANSPLLRIGASFGFILIIFLVDIALQADMADSELFQNVFDPEVRSLNAIPDCSEDLYLKNSDKKPCYNLLYAPQSNPYVKEVVESVIVSSGSRPGRFLGMETAAEMDAWLDANKERAQATVFLDVEMVGGKPTGIDYDLQTNSSVRYFKNEFQSPNFFSQVPVQVAIERESTKMLARYKYGSSSSQADISWSVGVNSFAHPPMVIESRIPEFAAPFLYAVGMFNFVATLTALVTERQTGQRQGMRNVGMLESSFWISWYLWEVVTNFMSSTFIVLFGMMFQFRIFLKNNYGLTFFLFFLFQMAMSGFAFIFFAFMRKPQSAVSIGFFVYFLGYIMTSVILSGWPYDGKYEEGLNYVFYMILSIFPWNLLAKGLQDFGDATATKESPGIRWNERSSYCVTDKFSDVTFTPGVYTKPNCSMPLDEIYSWLAVEMFILLLIAIYLDHIVPNEHNNYKPFYYFLDPHYWFPKKYNGEEHFGQIVSDKQASDASPGAGERNEDVRREEDVLADKLRRIVSGQETTETEDERTAMAVFGIKKTYASPFSPCGTKFEAVKGVWLSVGEGQIFCLLGPNGAGKTTLINCLTGTLKPTCGDSLMFGYSVKYELDKIRTFLGVCPQFDTLWETLTGREHLEIFATLKGMSKAEAKLEAEQKLEMVQLSKDADKPVSQYSGGMRRRVSVAISLIHDPSVIFLDEPTTGLDPVTRRHMWTVIQEAAKGRVIVLTTHSMEEADILGNRIAILSKGELHCIGSSVRLKSNFGSGYKLLVQLSKERIMREPTHAEDVISKLNALVGYQPIDQSNDTLTYSLSHFDADAARGILEKVEKAKAELGLQGLQLNLSSLEEVFLNVARGQTGAVVVGGSTGVLEAEG